MQGLTVDELKASLKTSARRGIALDIDETLAATNLAWFARCIELFGNPEGLTVPELIDKYHLAQYNPAWHGEEAQSWMHAQRSAPEAQDGLPLIPGALEGVKAVPPSTWVAYLTVRPRAVNSNTIAWLQECGFPDLPIVAKPDDVPFEDGNKWKADALHHLWPEVTGIVDDNPKVPQFAGKHYPGDIFLFGKDCTEPKYEWAIPCKHWCNVVETITRKARRNGIVS
jgi:hypothetical protein